MYAFIAAMAMNLSGVDIPEIFVPLFDNFRGAHSVLGMMIIGMSIISFRGLAGNIRFTAMAFFGKFVIWPLVAIGFWWLDATFLDIYDSAAHKAIFLISNTLVSSTHLTLPTNREAEIAVVAILFTKTCQDHTHKLRLS